jgi:predicted transcriptional regulator of viral defense system
MGSPTEHSAGRVWELAALQHGVVSRDQLIALGFSGRAVRHRVARGRLHEVGRGVYAVGRPRLTRRGRWMAAVLVYGRDSLLSHWSAAALLGLATEKHLIEVSVRTCSDRGRGVKGVRVHRRAGLKTADVAVWDRIPVTAPVRTLVDLAAVTGSAAIERMVNEADRLDLVDPETLRAALGAYRGQRGVARLRAVLDPRTFRRTRSGLERAFSGWSSGRGLPFPSRGSGSTGSRSTSSGLISGWWSRQMVCGTTAPGPVRPGTGGGIRLTQRLG